MKANFFKANRDKLRSKLALDATSIILVPAYIRMQFSSDQASAFLQESNFYYLSGINNPDCLLVISDSGEILLVPDTSEHSSLWDGQLDQETAVSLSGIETITDTSAGWQHLKLLLNRRIKTVYLPAPLPEFSYDGVYTNPAHRILVEKIKNDFPLIEIKDIRPFIAEQRAVKQPEEIELIKQAISTTAKSIQEALTNIRHGQNERQIDIELGYNFKKFGADDEAFRSIIAGGKRACTIHYNENNNVLNKDELLLIDVGARVGNYAADLSRTFAIDGKPTSRQQEVLQAVKSVYDFACIQIKPGVRFGDYETKVENEMGKTLKSLGILKSIDSKRIRQYFPHATSHLLGLDTHDVGSDPDTIFIENMVLTVEPGIYLPEEGIGVRLEDDFIITSTGVDNLCSELPVLM